MSFVSDAEFWRLHEANRHTSRYRVLRRQKIEGANGQCSGCGFRYRERGYSEWQLQMDHKRYRKDGELIFGKETLDDFRLRCPDCHTQGVASDARVKQERGAVLIMAFFGWLTRKGWRLALWLLLLPLRSGRSAFGRRSAG